MVALNRSVEKVNEFNSVSPDWAYSGHSERRPGLLEHVNESTAVEENVAAP